jgi:hypothetical protein
VRAVPSPLDSLHPRSRDDVGFHVRNSRSKNAVPASRDKEVAIKTDQHGAALKLNAISPIAKNLPTSFPPNRSATSSCRPLSCLSTQIRFCGYLKRAQAMGNFTRVSTKETTTSMGSQRVLRAYSPCTRLSLPKRYRPQQEPRKGTNPVAIAVAAIVCLFC